MSGFIEDSCICYESLFFYSELLSKIMIIRPEMYTIGMGFTFCVSNLTQFLEISATWQYPGFRDMYVGSQIVFVQNKNTAL
jgi:hypothetical protein